MADNTLFGRSLNETGGRRALAAFHRLQSDITDKEAQETLDAWIRGDDMPEEEFRNGMKKTPVEEATPDSPELVGAGSIKYDLGKPAVYQGVIKYFPRALWAVAEISTFGAEKYAWDGWADVENGLNRYQDARFRHALMDAMGESFDYDSERLHAAHEAWGALATLELIIRGIENEG